jgi:hypothetical protein
LADLVTAFGIILRVAEKTLAIIGFVSAVLDAIGGVFDAISMAKRNDYSAMAGYGMVAVGSAVIALGCATVIAGAGASASVVGLPLGLVVAIVGGILVAAGWLIAVFTRDSDIELYVNHCYWGKYYGQGSDSPKWALKPFQNWANDYRVQLEALFNILAGFTVESADYSAVTIRSGMVQPTSKFYLKFECGYNMDVVHRPQFMVDLETKQIQLVGGDVADMNKFWIRDGAKGSKEIRVDAEYPKDKPPIVTDPWSGERVPLPIMQHQYGFCEVSLDLLGDGKYWIPASRAWVKHGIWALGGGLNGTGTYSKDY